MKPELEHKLVEAYPSLFRGESLPKTESLMCFGCECGDGWYSILDFASFLISRHRNLSPDFKWFQIKEKWGTLRLYHDGLGDEYTRGVIAMAEAMSSAVCEQCGDAGKRRGGGWIRTLCDRCNDAKHA